MEIWPEMIFTARANRAFLGRAVRYLAGEAGIRQFLDIGTGIPTAGNTHQVAQAIAPESRVVYVDYDPIVLAHARALLISGQAGATDYIDADLRDTGTILSQAAKLLDFTQPVAVTTARTWWSPGWCGSRNGARSAAPARRASPPGGARWAASADLRPVASRQCLRGRRNGRDFRPAACAQDPPAESAGADPGRRY
jgi:hypothetical protein